MNPLRRRALILGFLSATSLPAVALAHHPQDFQKYLFEREQYFQLKGEPAPAFALQDVDEKATTLEELRGKAVVLYFIYAGCTDICPIHSAKIADVQEAVNATPMRDHVEFIAITTDPAADTPDILRGHGEAQGLDLSNWTFLTSGPERPEDTTRKLAEQFGHQFRVTSDGYQVHGIVTYVIDRNGTWSANFHGLGFETTNLVLYLNALVNDHHVHAEPIPTNQWSRLRALLRF